MLIVCIAIIIASVVYLTWSVTGIAVNQEAKLNQIQNQVNELENQIKKNQIEDDSEMLPEEKETNQLPVDKLKLAKPQATYEIADSETENSWSNMGLVIEIEDGKPYVSTDATNAQYQTLFPNVPEIKKQEIAGFTSKVTKTQYAVFGNDVNPPILLFLMEDGTVEYAKSLEMLQNKVYQSAGKVGELSNVVDFAYVSVQENAESGYISTVAVDNQGFYYDLNEIIENV